VTEEAALRESIRLLVMNFTTEMNEWELSYSKIWKEIIGKDQVEQAPVHSEYSERYREVFERYCTSRERKYGGPTGPKSAGFPTKYDKIDIDSIFEFTVKKSRIEAVFTATNISYKRFMFVFTRQNGEWRIDSYKTQFSDLKKWNGGIL
jgi:NTF2 fold immunity protein